MVVRKVEKFFEMIKYRKYTQETNFEEVISKIKAKKAFIVTDSIMYKIGLTKKFENILKEKNIDYRIFNEVEVDPSFEVVNKALDKVIDFLPDVIVAIGGRFFS